MLEILRFGVVWDGGGDASHAAADETLCHWLCFGCPRIYR